MQGRLKNRIIGNAVASGGSIFWSILMQLISIPVLASVWTSNVLGTWMMLSTIPTYLALTDFGFATAAANEMTMSYARGNRVHVLEVYRSLWTLTFGVSLIITAISAPLCLIPSLWSSFSSVHDWIASNGVALFVIIIYSGLFLWSRALLAAFRAVGLYAIGTIIYDAIQFAEGLSVLAVALLGGDFKDCAIAYAGIRFVNLLICLNLLARKAPWLRLGWAIGSFEQVGKLLVPSLAALLIPAALALNLQGVVLIIGLTVSPAAVAAFVPVRTASRMAVQFAAIVSRATMPEVSAAMARGDATSLRKLLQLNAAALMFILVPGAVCFAFVGRSLVSIWTRGQIVPEQSLVALVTIAMVFHGVWNFISNALLAVNAHSRFAYALMLSALLTVGLSVPVGLEVGLTGIGLVVVLGDALAAVAAVLIFSSSVLGSTRWQVDRSLMSRRT